MARDTPPDVRSLVIYQVFPRNYGPTGTLADLTGDLDRIAALGVDVVYLLPIHPIGVVGRKGTAGSPFAISDFRALSPELGTEADFDALIAGAHARGLKVVLDVVFNHTSPDSVLTVEHPEFFHRDAEGNPVSSVPAWTDIIDLKFPDAALSRYLVDSLAIWVRRGVDGFRCDSASLVPMDFWVRARSELAQIKPGLLWIAESVHPVMVEGRRAAGRPIASDAKVFEAFDVTYTWDVWGIWQAAVTGRQPVGRYLEMLRWQEASLPANYAKLRHAENHDNFRIMRFARNRDQALAWTALMAFSRGPLMFYAGQESAARKWPSLFEPDPVDWGTYELTDYLRALAGLKKHPAQREGVPVILADEPCVQMAWGALDGDRLAPVDDGPGLYGVFNVAGEAGPVPVQLPDGEYEDVLTGSRVAVHSGVLPAPQSAVALAYTAPFAVRRWTSDLLDLFLHVEEMGDE